jgi:antitoxin component YwqK of YwqJK toxin-antitoxin module
MKFIDYNSPEKAIINDHFKTIPYMDMWICSITEGYIYENVDRIFKINEKNGYKEEYTERYGIKEGEYKQWWNKFQIWIKSHHKRGKLDGERKVWFYDGQIAIQEYYKEGKLEGEFKSWHRNGQLSRQENYKDGKREGEFKWFNEQGILILHKIYKDGEVIEYLFNP